MMKKFILLFVVLFFLIGCSAQTIHGDVDITGSLGVNTISEYTSGSGVTLEGIKFEDSDVYIPTANYLYLNVGGTTYIYDNSGVLTFYDATTTTKTLAELAAGGIPDYGADNQIPFMNGTTDFDYSADLTWDGSSLKIGDGTGQLVWFRFDNQSTLLAYKDGVNSITLNSYDASYIQGVEYSAQRYGGTIASIAAAPSNAFIRTDIYHIYDGTSVIPAGRSRFQVDGAVATDNFNSKLTWDLKEGASASALMLTLGVNGLEYNADHSTDQAANDRWIPDKEYVDGVGGGGSYTFENGLTESSGTVKLGGALTGDTYITSSSTPEFEIRTNYSGHSSKLGTGGSSGTVFMQSFAAIDYATGSGYSMFNSTPSQASMLFNNGSNSSVFVITSSAMTITDAINSKGLYYAADYSSGATDRWIPDKEYVDGAGAGSDTVALGSVAPIHSDTIPFAMFGYGVGGATDTVACWDGAEIGAFLTGPSDTLWCVKFVGVVKSGEGTPTVTVQFYHDDNLGDATPTAILTSATAVTSWTSGTVMSSFSNQYILPNKWVWGKITTISAGNKPTKLRIQMFTYKTTVE